MANLIKLKTVQSSAIKVLIDTLNSLLTDVNINFYPERVETVDDSGETITKPGGIVIKEVNKTLTVLVYAKLDGFEEYEYNYPGEKLTIGVKLPNLLKCLKCMTHFDTMTWLIEEEDRNKLVVVLESSERSEKKIFKLNLMDLDYDDIEIDKEEFPYALTMPSGDFQKHCKDMISVGANKMEIQSTSNKLFLSGKSDLGTVDFEIGESIGGLEIDVNTDKNEIVQGLFELKYLTIFTKCTALCNEVKLFIKNDYALIIKYYVAALGEIKLVLSPSDTN